MLIKESGGLMSYQPVNLYYLYTASKISISDYRKYEKILSNRSKITNLGEREKCSLYYLVEALLNKCSIKKLDNFYYSYTIPHIGKEFDLLKITDNLILNIELKSQNVGLERIKAQLLRNYNYLKYLSKEMHLFTFVSDSKTLYKLDNELNLVKVELEEIIMVINLFDDDVCTDIDKLFKSSDYLVSPNASPEKFINGQYFLTTQQEYIKNKILDIISTHNIFKVTGEAGTGKTLLLFDIAKELSKSGKVLIVNCNKPNDAHKLINEHLENVLIIAQQEALFEIGEFDYILLDEAQRMKEMLWNKLQKYSQKKIIFSLDPKQVLTKEEIKANYNSLIDKLNPIKYKLSNRIRINNNIKEFTYCLFDLTRKKHSLDMSNVKIHYASNQEELETYFSIYKDDYTYITIPGANYNCGSIEKHEIIDVVGRDYENVLMVLDNNFFYSNMKLSSYNSVQNDNLYLKILYQGLSRTRENIVLIIYGNKKLFRKIIEKMI